MGQSGIWRGVFTEGQRLPQGLLRVSTGYAILLDTNDVRRDIEQISDGKGGQQPRLNFPGPLPILPYHHTVVIGAVPPHLIDKGDSLRAGFLTQGAVSVYP